MPINLISTRKYKITTFNDDSRLRYAIVSHTWSPKEQTSRKLTGASPRSKTRIGPFRPGYTKVKAVLALINKEYKPIEYVWLDTVCINKSNSQEVSESIISMFRYYEESALCLVYLEDFNYVDGDMSKLGECKWFRRAWTLLELLAPKEVVFYDRHWKKIGKKTDLADKLHCITGIPLEALLNKRPLNTFSIAQRMSWVSKRKATRPEDMAYCLMGIFQVQIPIMYGEGRSRAFRRLQEKIISLSTDRSIFAWKVSRSSDEHVGSLLAESPEAFQDCGDIVPYYPHQIGRLMITNEGLEMEVIGASCQDQQNPAGKDDLEFIAFLGCAAETKEGDITDICPIGVRLASLDKHIYGRVQADRLCTVMLDRPLPESWHRKVCAQMLDTKDSPTSLPPPIFCQIYCLPHDSITLRNVGNPTPLSLPLEVKLFPSAERSTAVFNIEWHSQTLCTLLVQGDFHVPRVVVNIITNIKPEPLPCAQKHTDHDTATVKGCKVTATARINPNGLPSSSYPFPNQSDQLPIRRHHNFIVDVEIKEQDSSLG